MNSYFININWRRHTTRFISDRTVKEKIVIWFIKDHFKAIQFRIFNLILRLLSCILYIAQTILDPRPEKSGHHVNSIKNIHHVNQSQIVFLNLNQNTTKNENNIIWNNLLFENRYPFIRYFQLVLAGYGLFETIFYLYLYYDGRILNKIKNVYFVIEILCTIPWFFEVCLPIAKNIYIPVFLNCWLVKRSISHIFKDYNNMNVKSHNSLISQNLVSLVSLVTCLIFTSLCGFEYLQRASPNSYISIFDSLYYIITTFSTVGYGDIVPDIWISKLYMAIMIIVALVVIPTQIEQLASLWFEKKTLGSSYGTERINHKHVVVSSPTLKYDTIFHFLSEFYAHRNNQGIHTVLLSQSELDIQLKSLLHTPLWKLRVFYINGSALRANDLERAKVDQAKAVFIISCRCSIDKDEADQHTILRSWAIKEFAPNTTQYVQLFRPENRIHIKFVENIVCEDEFKYALLANNCLCPGISTLVTLLIHKGASKAKPTNEPGWQNLYAHMARNEIHAITAENSKFFQEFIGKPFTYASYAVHQKYNVCLIGIGTFKKEYKSSLLFDNTVKTTTMSIDEQAGMSSYGNTAFNTDYKTNMSKRTVLLNPGSQYQIEAQDLCFYISLTKEENYEFKTTGVIDELAINSLNTGKYLYLKSFANHMTIHASSELDSTMVHHHKTGNEKRMVSNSSVPVISMTQETSNKQTELDLIIGKPPYPLYIGSIPPLCKLLKIPNQVCCLQLDKACVHKSHTQAFDYKWRNKCVIIAAEDAKNGLFNFILPLRAKIRSDKFLKPIVLLLENMPSIDFLESICCFPLIFYLQGNISNVTTLLKAGITECDALVVTSTEKHRMLEDESLTDCASIFSVQNVCRLFSNVNVILELTKPDNIRFTNYRSKNIEKEQIMHIMYRKPFAAGSVFSDALIETLVSLAFRKPYMIELLRLLIGITYSEGSGNLKSIPLSEEDLKLQSYGNLYRKLATTTSEIPIGIYRIEKQDKVNEDRLLKNSIQKLIEMKMTKLKIDLNRYDLQKTQMDNFSYVLINPSSDFQLQSGDLIYLLKPGKSN